jgi:hypothetical protein
MAKTGHPATAPISAEIVEQQIFLICGQKVMLDRDLAGLYGVQTFRLNEAVKRNRSRFPNDFMFQLTAEEAHSLTSHFAISKAGRGGRRTLPYAFTEQGVSMLSSVLNSERAIQVNIAIMRTFVRLRAILASNAELAKRLVHRRRCAIVPLPTRNRRVNLVVDVAENGEGRGRLVAQSRAFAGCQ